MTIGFNAAFNEICSQFYAKWKADAPAVVGYIPEVRWPYKEVATIPSGSKYWVRFSSQNVFEEQTTLSSSCGLPGQKRFTASGLVFIQLFLPQSDAANGDKGRQLAMIARDAYRGKSTSGKVWFRNARINDGIAPENSFNRLNVVAEFEHDDLG